MDLDQTMTADDDFLIVWTYVISVRAQMYRMRPETMTPAQMKALVKEGWDLFAAMKAGSPSAGISTG